MEMMDFLATLSVGAMGIVLGSIANYFLLRKLFRKQANEIIGDITGTGKFDELLELIHKAKEFTESKDAHEILEQFKRIMKEL